MNWKAASNLFNQSQRLLKTIGFGRFIAFGLSRVFFLLNVYSFYRITFEDSSKKPLAAICCLQR